MVRGPLGRGAQCGRIGCIGLRPALIFVHRGASSMQVILIVYLLLRMLFQILSYTRLVE